MYFAAWSNNVITNAVYLSNSLKMGEYRESNLTHPIICVVSLTRDAVNIPPRSMFIAQIYGTVLGGFVNYAVMVFVVDSHRDLLRDEDGNAVWSGMLHLRGLSLRWQSILAYCGEEIMGE